MGVVAIVRAGGPPTVGPAPVPAYRDIVRPAPARGEKSRRRGQRAGAGAAAEVVTTRPSRAAGEGRGGRSDRPDARAIRASSSPIRARAGAADGSAARAFWYWARASSTRPSRV